MIVGTEPVQKTFHLHASLLTHASPTLGLRVQLTPLTSDDPLAQKTITLAETDPGLFEHFAWWLYARHVEEHPRRGRRSILLETRDPGTLARLYALGVHLDAVGFRAAAYNTLSANVVAVSADGGCGPTTAICEMLEVVCTMGVTGRREPLRELVVWLVGQCLEDLREAAPVGAQLHKHPGLAKELLKHAGNGSAEKPADMYEEAL